MVIGKAWRCWGCGKTYHGCVGGMCGECRNKDTDGDEDFLKLEEKVNAANGLHKFTVSATVTQTIEKELYAKDREDAAHKFVQESDVTPQFVDDDMIIGLCESCSKIIFEDDPDEYLSGDEHGPVCKECVSKMIKEALYK